MNGVIPRDLIEEVRSRIDIVDVIGEAVSLERRGRSFWGLCPFHSERTPSFTVSQEKQFFYCFGCQAGGNVYTFLMKARNIGFIEAVEHLAARAGIAIPELNPFRQATPTSKRLDRLRQVNQLAAGFYHKVLLHHSAGQKARAYLRTREVDEESIERFNLGYALAEWSSLIKYTGRQGVQPEELLQAGLVIAREKPGSTGFYDRFRNRIMFPITDLTGGVVGFGGRALDGENPKYLNSPETEVFQKGSILYGLTGAAIRRNHRALLVEGYMDVIAAHRGGLEYTVSCLGTALTESQAGAIRRFCEEIVVCFDPDAAGVAAAFRSLQILARAGLVVRVLKLPEELDPDEYIRKYGSISLEKLLESSLSLLEYKLERAITEKGSLDARAKGLIVSQLLPDLLREKNAVARDGYVRLIARKLDVSESSIYEEISQRSRGGASSNSFSRGGNDIKDRIDFTRNNNHGQTGPTVLPSAERYFLQGILNDSRLLTTMRSQVNRDYFVNPKAGLIWLALLDLADNSDGRVLDGPAVLEALADPEARDLAGSLLSLEEPVVRGEALADSVRALQRAYLGRQFLTAQKELAAAEYDGREDLCYDLQVRLRDLSKSLADLKTCLCKVKEPKEG